MPPRSTVQSSVSDVDVVVLAGGLGTRLDGLLTDAPKIMAPIGGRPFLEYLLGWLIEQRVARVILGLGHKAKPVLEYLEAHSFPPMEVVPVVEPHPLGTAGALGFASACLRSDPVMVMNGDTFVEADLSVFLASHRNAGTSASVLSVKVDDPHRYGRIEISSSRRIARFEEKSSALTAPSWINAGIYLFDRTILERIVKLKHGSIERDVLEAMPPGSVHACRTEGRFLDIGTPESLAQASAFFACQDLIPRELNS